ncbi:MAG: amino acid adenylation domain-containing protein [Legionellaceae bacterium]
MQAQFEALAEEFPSHIAAIHEAESITNIQLNQRANQFARALQSEGVSQGSTVALCMPRSIDLLIVMLGILKAGAAYLPLDASHPKERLQFILNDSNAACLITELAFKPLDSYATNNLDLPIHEDGLAYIIYTSGSTGQPKGVLIQHKGLMHYCRWFAKYSQCLPKQRIDFSSNPIFDMAVTTSMVALALNLTIVVCSDAIKHNPMLYLNHIKSNQIHLIKITPTYLCALLQQLNTTNLPLPDLQKIILGGEALRKDSCAEWLHWYPNHTLYNEYGPTETTVAVLAYAVHKDNIDSFDINIPIGLMHPSIYVLNSDLKPVEQGQPGELFISGPGVARGYLNQPELTKKSFINHLFSPTELTRLYKTGDLCRVLPDKSIEYLGRIDSQVKIRGFRIELGEIEHCLLQHPAIIAASILALSTHTKDPQLVVYYISKTPNIFNSNELQTHLSRYLPHYMVPSTYIEVSHLPFNENGKLDTSALPTPESLIKQGYVPASSPLEQTLVDIWKVVLGVSNLGIHDNFFELGGHSLSAARAISCIENQLNKQLTLNALYTTPTIASLALLLETLEPTAPVTLPLKKINKKSKNFPLSDFQLIIWISRLLEPNLKKLNVVARKRIFGKLDTLVLSQAFDIVFKKNEILRTRMKRFYPTQSIQNTWTFSLYEKNLIDLSKEACELTLTESMQSLLNYYPWHKKHPLLRAHLFYLDETTYELQIAMPHHVCDEASVHILFSDLSNIYLALLKQQSLPQKIKSAPQFKDYIIKEQAVLTSALDQHIPYWKNYLKNANLVQFKQNHVVKNMDKKKLNYSSYIPFPEQTFETLKVFCANHQVAISDVLCAALGKALLLSSDTLHEKNNNLFITTTKSTRDNPAYDETIGCFLASYPINLELNQQHSLALMSKNVQENMMNNSPYQKCPSLIKLACIHHTSQKKSIIINIIMSFLRYVYRMMCRFPVRYFESFKYIGALAAIDRKKSFIVLLNIWNSFLDLNDKTSSLFGARVEDVNLDPYDLLKSNQIFDVCFLREQKSNQAFVIISSNLTPTFREKIGEEILRILSDPDESNAPE